MCPRYLKQPRPGNDTTGRCAMHATSVYHQMLPRPLPTSHWPEENVRLLERYYTWLISGGASEYFTNTVYLPIAGHVLGLNLLPHEQLDLGPDLMRALEYVRAKGVGEPWLKACRNGLNKFRRFLRLERGLDETRREPDYDVGVAHTRASGLAGQGIEVLSTHPGTQLETNASQAERLSFLARTPGRVALPVRGARHPAF